MKKIIIILMLITNISYAQKKYESNNQGFVLAIGGLSFTTSAILEGGYMFGTNKQTSNNTVSYVIPPFYKQTSRVIMLIVGVSFTVTGLLTMKSKN